VSGGYHDGWRAVCPWPGPSSAEAGKGFGEPISAATLARLDAEGWELYHVAKDPAENHNLATDHRDRLIALIATWYVEAGKYDVMPVDGSGLARFVSEKPMIAAPRDSFVYYPNTQSVPFFAGARVLNRPHSITADVEIPEQGAEGVLLAQGTAAGAVTLYVKHRRLRYTHNWVGHELQHLTSDVELEPGRHELRYEFEPHGQPDLAKGHGMPGRFQLYVDGTLTGDLDVPYTTPFAFNPGGLTWAPTPDQRSQTTKSAEPLHRDAAHGHRRPQRRADHRPGGRAQTAHGTPVAPARTSHSGSDAMPSESVAGAPHRPTNRLDLRGPAGFKLKRQSRTASRAR
jgi:hypothetical protein